jgi:pyruvate dehydrogenase kinase 2/3/4
MHSQLGLMPHVEELPIRLAHRVKELEEVSFADMPSIIKVKNWYAQSFQVMLVTRMFRDRH